MIKRLLSFLLISALFCAPLAQAARFARTVPKISNQGSFLRSSFTPSWPIAFLAVNTMLLAAYIDLCKEKKDIIQKCKNSISTHELSIDLNRSNANKADQLLKKNNSRTR